jgi:hypothetical protein
MTGMARGFAELAQLAAELPSGHPRHPRNPRLNEFGCRYAAL